jgi:CotH protein
VNEKSPERKIMRRLSAVTLAVLLSIWTVLGLVGPAAAATTVAAPVSSLAHPYVDEAFVLSGSLGTSGVRDVTLQHHTSKWKSDQTVKTKSDGSYRFTASTSKTERDFRVSAPAAGSLPAVTSPAVTIKTRDDAVRLVLSRNRTTGLAIGTAAVENGGRQWALQVKKGSSWTTLGAKVAEGAKGAVRASFPLQNGSYRLVGNPVAKGVDGKDLPGATSATMSFKTGPSSLGKRVMFIATDSGATPKTKGKDYTATVGLNDDAPLALETVAVRGNSSATYPKKPYKVKFEESQSPFGLPKGKTFILLPNFQDHSLVRTAVTMTHAAQMDGLGWTPHRIFTEVFLNGKYLGSYELIESIKIQQKSKKNDPRVDIDPEKGVIIEINPAGASSEIPGLFKGDHGMWYGFKDPDEKSPSDPEAATPEKIALTKKKIEKFESVLYGKDYKDPVNGWRKYLDEDSAVDFYLENEFIKNWDGDFFRSTFYYTPDHSDPNAKLFMGPIWDVDRSAASKTSGTSSVTSTKGWWMDGSGVGHGNQSGDVHGKHWFARITNDAGFQKALKARWAEKRSTFKAVGDYKVDAAVSELGKNVAANDRDLWQKSQPVGRYLPRAKSYDGEITYLKKWYTGRYKWMDGKLD